SSAVVDRNSHHRGIGSRAGRMTAPVGTSRRHRLGWTLPAVRSPVAVATPPQRAGYRAELVRRDTFGPYRTFPAEILLAVPVVVGRGAALVRRLGLLPPSPPDRGHLTQRAS